MKLRLILLLIKVFLKIPTEKQCVFAHILDIIHSQEMDRHWNMHM